MTRPKPVRTRFPWKTRNITSTCLSAHSLELLCATLMVIFTNQQQSSFEGRRPAALRILVRVHCLQVPCLWCRSEDWVLPRNAVLAIPNQDRPLGLPVRSDPQFNCRDLLVVPLPIHHAPAANSPLSSLFHLPFRHLDHIELWR